MSYKNIVRSLTAFPRLLPLATGLLVALLVLTPRSFAADTGRITGTVNSKVTGNALQGAVVSVVGTNRSAQTDNSGYFVLTDVPAGTVKVVASYAGFEGQTQELALTPGGNAQAAIEMQPSDVVAMAPYTVSSIKEGAALSLTEQRKAANVKSVVAMDEWGTLPTQNVGEIAMRLPGVTFGVDTDDNLINGVSIRGQPTNFTRVNIDGMSTTGVGGDGRAATLYSFSGAQYEQIEIIAGQTPDKRADSIGGQLNLKTRSPLAMKEKRRFSYNLAARWAPPTDERTDLRGQHALHPVGSFGYQEVFDLFGGKRNFGVSVIASYSENVNPIANNTLLYRNATDAVVPFVDYADFYGINHRGVFGVIAKSDYRYSDHGNIAFSFLYNEGAEPFFKRTKINPFAGNNNIATVDANGAFTSTGAIVPGFTANRTDIRAVTGSTLQVETDSFSFYSKNPTGTISGAHDFGQLKLEYSGRFSYTHFDSGARNDKEGGALFLRTVVPIAFTLDKTNLAGQVFTQTAGPDVHNAASYIPLVAGTNFRFDKRKTLADTKEASFRVDATYNFETTIPLSVKTGIDFSDRTVDQGKGKDRRWIRNVGTPALSGVLVPLTRFEQEHGGTRLPVFTPESVSAELLNPALWTEDASFAAARPFISRRHLRETVPAAYIQGLTTVQRLTMLIGVRGEKVEADQFTFFRRTTPASLLETDPFKKAALEFQKGGQKGSYTKYFPSAHFAYDITANLKARASWSNSYGRPTIQQLTPTPSVNETTRVVTEGNPALRPQLAENIDLKLEYYFKSNGLVSIGAFQKTIKDFISPTGTIIGQVGDGANNGFDGNFAGFDVISSTNLGEAQYRGLEFDYRQRLVFLPGYLKGITLAANFTVQTASGKFDGAVAKGSRDVPGFTPRTGNVRLLYNYKRFGTSFAANYSSEQLLGFTAVGSSLNFYRKSLTMINAGFTYKIRPEMTFYVDANNIFEKGPVSYRFVSDRTRSITNGAMTVSFGISGQF